jgi:hypothetical protein
MAESLPPGLIDFYAGVSPEGSIAQVSVWDSGEYATFHPIVNYPVNWTI